MSAPAATAQLRPRGLLGSAISTDHKSIARGLLAVALVMFLGGGVMALIMRSELAQPGLQVVSTGTYNALFTMHGSTMIYAVVIPLGLALGVYLVPLQVGAAQIAGPRVALVGFWLFVFGAITMEAGWLTNGGPGRATWIGVAPLSELQRTPNAGQDLWILGVRRPLARAMAAGAVRAVHRPAQAGPGHDAAAHGAVHVEHGGDDAHGRLRLPRAGGADGPALVGPAQLLPVRRRQRTTELPAPVLVLRAPDRLRHVLPLRRGRSGGVLGLLPAGGCSATSSSSEPRS